MIDDHVYSSLDGSTEDFSKLVDAPVLAFDVEATGVNMGRDLPLGFSMAHNPVSFNYCSIDSLPYKSVLADDSKLYIAHNAKYDRSMMKKVGVTIDNLCCTQIAAHLVGNQQLSLKALALKYAGLDVARYSELGKKFLDMDIHEMGLYSGPHSAAAYALWNILKGELNKLGLLRVFWDVEMPLVPVLSDMELNGVMVDPQVLRELGDEFDDKIRTLEGGMSHWAGSTTTNFNSPDQIAELFYNKLRIPPDWVKTTKGRPSVRADYLVTVKDKHPIIGLYLLYKQYQKLKSNYVNGLLKELVNGRIYGSFNQTRTRTSRLSSSGPNLQNIPMRRPVGRRIRRAFVAPEGYSFVKPDYDQIELRMMAHCSQDQGLLQAFRDERDIHAETAARLYGTIKRRPEGKTANFQIIYQGGDKKTREALEKAYPEVFAWTRRANSQAREGGFARTLGGRIRFIEELWSSIGSVASRGEREAISTIIQGSSAEVVKAGMVSVWKKIRDTNVKMVLQVHDEVVFEVPDNEVGDFIPFVRETMRYDELSVPFTVSVSVGKDWENMQEVKECQE